MNTTASSSAIEPSSQPPTLAPTSSGQISGTHARAEPLEPTTVVPESGSTLVVHSTPASRMSSVPADESDLRSALIALRRYGATLNGLLSAVDSFSRGVEAARSANEALVAKLERAQQSHSLSEQQAGMREAELARRVEHLEQKLRSQRKAFEQERRFLTEDQDDFLRALLEEHEEELAVLRQERDEALRLSEAAESKTGSAPADKDAALIESLRREIATLRVERESSRALAQRMRAQRDQAQEALRQIQRNPSSLGPESAHPTTPAPPPFSAGRSLQVPPAPRAPIELARSLTERDSALGELKPDLGELKADLGELKPDLERRLTGSMEPNRSR